jgi:threonine dehydrogenase-like Zn-dependent dehydrogenase
MTEATAFWIFGPGQGALRSETLPTPGAEDVLVTALASGISRGTESLVFRGRVPASQHSRMKAPFQDGSFHFPIKYGYASVGRVESGPEELIGNRVFCLYPHQDRYVVPASAVVPVPDEVSTPRAVLAANMETAINGLWDAEPRIGDQVAVVGAGVVCTLAAALLARIPGVSVELIDVNPGKAAIAEALDLPFSRPEEAEGGVDLVIHASGQPEGLRTALSLAGFEATILELSWYGDQPVTLPLGEDFHSRRLRLISSQVGEVARPVRGRWTHKERLSLALDLLADEAFDALLAPSKHFSRLPTVMSGLADSGQDVMCQVIAYS